MERDIARIALFAGLIAALGQVPPVMLGFGVPISAQSLGVMLAGAVLGSKNGGLAALLFVFAVTLGLPLLSGGRGGLGVYQGATVGFFVAFPVAAFVTGLVVERLRFITPAISAGLGAMIGGIGVMYVFGIIGMAYVLQKTIPEAAALTVAFIPGDIIKAVLTGFLVAALAKVRPHTLDWYKDRAAGIERRL